MKSIGLLVVMLMVSGPAVAAEPLHVITEEFAPYQFFEGKGEQKKLTGISIDIVKAIQAKPGSAEPIEVMPWSRGLKLLITRKNAILSSTTRTPDREPKYKWVGPLAPLEMVFFKKAGSPIRITSLEDAKSLAKIGVTKNVATHEVLMNKGFTNLDVMQSGADEKNLRRLLKGRIDVWPTAYYAGVYSAKKLGIIDQVEVIKGVLIASGELYIAFNKGADDAVVAAWQTALDELRQDGSMARIMKSYDR